MKRKMLNVTQKERLRNTTIRQRTIVKDMVQNVTNGCGLEAGTAVGAAEVVEVEVVVAVAGELQERRGGGEEVDMREKYRVGFFFPYHPVTFPQDSVLFVSVSQYLSTDRLPSG